MSILNQSFRKNTLVVAVLAAIGMPAAHALEIKAEVLSGSVGTGTLLGQVDTASSGSVGVYGFESSGSSSASYSITGNDTSDFRSRVSGNGVYDVTGIFSYTDTITNTTGIDQLYDFDFSIIPGRLSLTGEPTAPGEFLLAEYSIDIRVDGTSIWNSSASVEKNSASSLASFTYGGTSLGGSTFDSTSNSGYMWSSFADTVALGVLEADEYLNFEYILTTRVAGNISNCNADGQFDGGEGDIPFDGGEGGCGSMAGNGDPFGFGSGNNSLNISSTPVVNPVPEPGSLALLGLGLVGVVATRRRKNKAS